MGLRKESGMEIQTGLGQGRFRGRDGIVKMRDGEQKWVWKLSAKAIEGQRKKWNEEEVKTAWKGRGRK